MSRSSCGDNETIERQEAWLRGKLKELSIRCNAVREAIG